MSEKIIYLRGLNGIRAIASIAVVISHVSLELSAFGLDEYIFGVAQDGSPKSYTLAGYGVSMFFALSGFLITYLLMLEKSKVGISIKKFYWRRILRIWPLYYGYMLLCFLCYFIFDLSVYWKSTPYYLFFAANVPFILGRELFLLGHFWSLAVEEQFYMFWPWLNKIKISSLKWIVLWMIVLLIGAKLVLHFIFPGSILESVLHVTRFHCMLMGCLAALLYFEKRKFFLTFTTHAFMQLLAWLAMCIVVLNRFHVASVIDNELITLVTILIIMGQITEKGGLSLENKLFNFLGKISYGVYVIHPIIIFLCTKFLLIQTGLQWLDYALVYSIILVLTIVVSYVSFNYFENIFLSIKKKKFTVIPSAFSSKGQL